MHVFAKKVRKKIRKDIGNSLFCIILDEVSDESKNQQMTLVLRFIDIKGCVHKRFFWILHVKDTSLASLYSEICSIFSNHELNVQKICGQGYDGASNMHGEWSSHFASVSGLLNIFDAACEVLENVKEDDANYKLRGGATIVLKRTLSFEFIFSLDVWDFRHKRYLASYTCILTPV